jgi:hypothetical protein
MNAQASKNLTGLAVKLAEWSEDADKWQHSIPFDNPTAWNDYLARGVKDGSFVLLDITHKGERVGILVYRVDASAARELVIVAAYCNPIPGEDVSSFIVKTSEAIGHKENCQSVRFHTLRPGLITKTTKAGFRVAEIVLRKSLENHE